MRKPNRFSRSERGQAIVLIAFAILGLFAIVGLAVDGGMVYADRRQAQNAADSAALASALAHIRGGNYRAAALQQAAENGYANDGGQSEVQVNFPPLSGPYRGNTEYIQVIITSRQRTVFGSVVGIRQITNTVEAVARVDPPLWDEIMDGYAVISLAPTSDCQNNKAFWLHGESTLRLQGGGVWINSNHPTCALIQQGSASLAFEDNSPFTIVGGISIQKPQLIKRQVSAPGYLRRAEGGSFPFQPTVGAAPIPYPPPFVMPRPSCGAQEAEVLLDRFGAPTGVMTAGRWGGDFPPEGVTMLESGIYCIDGDVHVSDTLIGEHVVLVVEHGSVRFNGSATIQLTAPGSGPFQGLLIYLPMHNRNRVVLNGNAESVFRGTILAPASLIRITGNDSTYGYHSQIIGYYIELAGNSNILVRYVDEQNYDAFISPSIEISQ